MIDALKKCANAKNVSPRYDSYHDVKESFENVRHALSVASSVRFRGAKIIAKRKTLRKLLEQNCSASVRKV